MRLPSVVEFLDTIEELELIDDVIIKVIKLIPARYFYHPYIYQPVYQKKREEIRRQRSKMYSFAYREDRATKLSFYQLVKAYGEDLDVLVYQLKSDLALYLLYLDVDSKRQFLEEKIELHRLLPYLIPKEV